MKNLFFIAGILVAVVSGARTIHGQLSTMPVAKDIGRAARQVFAAKCAGCHGSDLEKPRGRFGYVLDLRRIAANAEMVVPSSPDESELWNLVQHDEMPPSDSPHGPLTAEQKETIRAWIAAGAPDVVSVPTKSGQTLNPSADSASVPRGIHSQGCDGR